MSCTDAFRRRPLRRWVRLVGAIAGCISSGCSPPPTIASAYPPGTTLSTPQPPYHAFEDFGVILLPEGFCPTLGSASGEVAYVAGPYDLYASQVMAFKQGQSQWSVQFAGPVLGLTALADGEVLVLSAKPAPSVVRLGAGQVMETKPISELEFAQVTEGQLDSSGQIVTRESSGLVYHNPARGKAWRYVTEGAPGPGVAMGFERVAFTGCLNSQRADCRDLSLVDSAGQLMWMTDIWESRVGSPVVSTAHIAIASDQSVWVAGAVSSLLGPTSEDLATEQPLTHPRSHALVAQATSPGVVRRSIRASSPSHSWASGLVVEGERVTTAVCLWQAGVVRDSQGQQFDVAPGCHLVRIGQTGIESLALPTLSTRVDLLTAVPGGYLVNIREVSGCVLRTVSFMFPAEPPTDISSE